MVGAAIAGGVGLWVASLAPSDDLGRVLRRLRVTELPDAPAALALALSLRGLRPVAPWMVATWLEGADVPEVRPALDAMHLHGREGARILLRLTRGR